MAADVMASLRVWSAERADVEQFADAVEFKEAEIRGNRPGTQWIWRWDSPLGPGCNLDTHSLRVAQQVVLCPIDIPARFPNRSDVFFGVMPDEDIALQLSLRSIDALAATGIDVNIDVYPVSEIDQIEVKPFDVKGGSSVAVVTVDTTTLVLELPRGSREWHRLVDAGVDAIGGDAVRDTSPGAALVFMLNLGSSSVLPFSSSHMSRINGAQSEIRLLLKRPADS